MSAKNNQPEIVQWLLDTRPLWPVPKKANSRDEVAELKIVASRELSLLTGPEKESVLKYYFLKDAKMSLASHLLKHLVITKYCGISWADSKISRDKHSKPCFLAEENSECPKIDFNVSHQAGIVTLIAAIRGAEKVQVGTDVVCVNERSNHDYAYIDAKGFFDWVDMHGEVFAESEIRYMKFSPALLLPKSGYAITNAGEGTISNCERRNEQSFIQVISDTTEQTSMITMASNSIIDQKIRRFYAMWCLREAYVKMTGEALMASWLKDLHIPLSTAPQPSQDLKHGDTLAQGEYRTVAPVYLTDQTITDVAVDIRAIGSDYMIAGVVKFESESGNRNVQLGQWTPLALERDVLCFAESRL